MPSDLLSAKTESEYREIFDREIATRDDFTSPERGWPWPWETSHTTDYAYAFDSDGVWAAGYDGWFDASKPEPQSYDEDDNYVELNLPTPVFPDMSDRQNVQFGGPQSGLMIISTEVV